MSITVRPASLSDVSDIVPFLKISSGGMSDFLLMHLIPNMSVDDLIEMALTDENTTYYYPQFIVAEENNRIVGAAHFYSSDRHGLPDLMRSMIPKDKLDRLAPYFSSSVPNSMYIHAMATAESHRRSLCGLLMGKKIETIAKIENKTCLSAHVWRENKLVYTGLQIAGFRAVESFLLPTEPPFIYHSPMVLMKGPEFR
jgi:hypothetical protein